MSVESEFIEFSVAKLEQLMERIGSCAAKLTAEQIWMRGAESQNAIGNLLLHLNGNVRQWILFGVGGQPDRRDRDLEFSARAGQAPGELIARLRSTVGEASGVIRGLTKEQLLEATSVQGYNGTKLAAVYHVVEHFAGHAFQIMFATKQLTGEDLGFYGHLQGGGAASGEKRP